MAASFSCDVSRSHPRTPLTCASTTRSVPQTLASSTARRAIVYNDDLWELGGGERSTLAYAKALQELGFLAEVLSVGEVPPRETLNAHFGDEFACVPIRTLSRSLIDSSALGSDVAIFVNHTFMSFLPNPAPLGIYAQMFPAWTLRSPEHKREIKAVQTYQLMLSNSEFTQKYTRLRWPIRPRRLGVLRPPIGSVAVEWARRFAFELPRKTKQFVHVGRFNPDMHNKNQLVIIETFLQACARHPVLRDWRLVLMGTLGASEAARLYHEQCSTRAALSAGRVSVRTNVSEAELNAALTESFAYVHATGAFFPKGLAPERCEHFGLSILEAMAHACLALVYGRGGIWEVADGNPGVRGYLTVEELIDGYAHLASLYRTSDASKFQTRNISQALVQDFDSFRARLSSFLGVSANLAEIEARNS